MLTSEEHGRCLEMCRRLAIDFDGDAAEWLIKHEALAEEFMMGQVDLLSSSERMSLYLFWFGLFPSSSERIIELRLKAEQDPECRDELGRIAKMRRQKPCSKAERLAELEKDLENENPLLRCSAAMLIYAETGKTKTVLPILLEMLRSRDPKSREVGARGLGQLRRLSREAIHELRPIANNPSDPLRAVAEAALSRHKGLLNWLRRRVL